MIEVRQTLQIDLSTVFCFVFFFSTFDTDKLGKISRLHCKDRLQISRVATFKTDLLKTTED